MSRPCRLLHLSWETEEGRKEDGRRQAWPDKGARRRDGRGAASEWAKRSKKE